MARSSLGVQAERLSVDPMEVDQILEGGATTIMLRSLPSSTTTSSLMGLMGQSFLNAYDFLYLPWCTRQPRRIVEMAFINFVDHFWAKRAVELFLETIRHGSPSWARTRVSQARIQGLRPNLAYFTLRFGEAAITDPDAPSVFVDGHVVSLAEHCATHINADAMRLARSVLEKESHPRALRSREQVDVIWVAPSMGLSELLELANRHQQRLGYAIFRL